MKGLGGHVTLEEHISDRVETVTQTLSIYYLNGKEMTTYKSIVKIKCTYYINVETEDLRSSFVLLQRLEVAIQRGNDDFSYLFNSFITYFIILLY